MAKTTKERILAKVKRASKGRLFVTNDFIETGSSEAVRKVLHELNKEEILIRVYSGVYQKPNYNAYLEMKIPAATTDIAEAIAKKNCWTITPAKDMALNLLGLDTQVPNSYVFISDGPSKTIRLNDGRIIKFRHVTQRESRLSTSSALVVEAFKALGEESVTDDVLQQIKHKLSTNQINQLKKESTYSRAWIRKKIKRMDEIA
ncbi:DUF6088 family protein [Candidatus Enterococcus ferrettii]|uniref:Type IV toxin-antitoxin system AbiEi family antitoxin domain-containing protein n=1 Tax=Candidatus Enterococcus ferrettii TaxID=2815324 RepID=A0ABV0EJJ4_9ENTE|nr:DUF6088 family protein [Enterococcus sp. 665A]MBO1338482.1 hypothetical protein [Enterococcus sp. 665A]